MADGETELRTTRLYIAGMDCPDEVAELKRLLAGRDGIADLSFNLMQSTMTVRHDPTLIAGDEIADLVKTTGMTATGPEQPPGGQPPDRGLLRGPLWMTLLAAAGTAAGVVLSYVPAGRFGGTTWPAAVAFSLAIIAAWRYIAPTALAAVRRLRLDMNVLMTIAVVGALALGEWFEASTVAFLFMLSHLLESWSVSRARRAIQTLMQQTPATARVRQADGSEREVETAEVAVGRQVIVKPGEKFPLDGRIVEGSTTVNQAPVTGESVPVGKQPGDEVFAGTVNQDGAVVIEVTKAAGDTVLAGIIRLVEQAQAHRSPSERFVDRFARYYTPAVVIGAILLTVGPPVVLGAAWGVWFYRSLVLLVIACPCALVISTPVSIVSGLTSAARNGVLIKGGEYLESVGRASVVALDKTGTLTAGRPVVQKVIPADDVSERTLLSITASIEQRSEHPIAEAILQYARDHGIAPQPCDDYQAVRGKGARAAIDGRLYLLGNHRLLEENGLCTDQLHALMSQHEDCDHIVVALSSNEKPLGVILLADALRPQAPASVAALYRTGVQRIVMLTGDNAGTAKAIADQCGRIDYRAELLPADKVAAVTALKADGGRVVMVGDGINDAPALAAADVGVAMGAAGTDAAIETADVALMTDDLDKLPWLIRHSRRTRGIIIQNIALSLGIKAVFLGLAIPGLATLWMAIVADMGASLLVTFNGLRLLRPPPN